VIKKPLGRGGHTPRWAAEPEKIILMMGIVVIKYHVCTTSDTTAGNIASGHSNHVPL
jgi:hypothetical protein